jgi:sec-independent protein translocase protein TatC
MPEGQGIFEGFWGHITEFIKRMKVVLGVFLVSLIVMLVLPGNSDFFALSSGYEPLMSVLVKGIGKRFLPADVMLFAGAMSDPITLYVYAALIFAIGITLPVFAYEAYKFINPALYDHERKAIFPFLTAVIVLFAVGAVFGFFFLAPSFVQGFQPFFDAVNAAPLYPIMDFYSMIFSTIIISGVVFTIPAFFVLMVKFGILHTKTVTKHRKYIYGGIVVAALLISPGATPLGDLYLFISLLALVEVSIFVGKRFEQKSGTANAQSALSKWLAPVPTCRFCKQEIPENIPYCPSCKRYLV